MKINILGAGTVDIRTYLNVTKDSKNPEIVDDSLKINYDE